MEDGKRGSVVMAQLRKVFDAEPEPMRTRLYETAELVLSVASENPEIGPLVQTLKWNEPAFLPAQPRIGTTVRVSAVKGSASRFGVYFNCNTSLLDTFRTLYPQSFAFEGDRALLFDVAKPLPSEPLRHCIALALTYHQRKRLGIAP